MFYHAFKIILRVLSLNLIGAFNFFINPTDGKITAEIENTATERLLMTQRGPEIDKLTHGEKCVLPFNVPRLPGSVNISLFKGIHLGKVRVS